MSRLFSVMALVLVFAGCSLFEGAEPTHTYGIIYGVTDYASLGDVVYASNDAMDMSALLSSQWLDGGAGEIIVRTDGDATKANLLADFAYMTGLVEAEPNSRFFFYFAGHGFGDGMETRYPVLPLSWQEYFAANSDEPVGAGEFTDMVLLHDAVAPSADDVAATLAESLTDDELATLVDAVLAKCKIVVIDACHSGGFLGDDVAWDAIPRAYEGSGEGFSFIDALSSLTLYMDYGSFPAADLEGTAVISAAGEQEFSYDSSLSGSTPSAGSLNGMFTYYFMESATNGDRNYDGLVTVSEAYQYAAAAIIGLENEYLLGDGKFVPRVTGGAVDFVLFRTD